jgi:FixJ family two-component response regulator
MNTSMEKRSLSTDDGLVLVVDDDPPMRAALVNLFRSVGLTVEALAAADELLGHGLPERPTCVVLDVRLRGISGLELQAKLAQAGMPAAIVFITGHGDVPMSVAAMKAGAIDFISKPFRDQELLDAVYAALEHDRQRRSSSRQSRHLRVNYDALTPREREVMSLATQGLMNKQIAAIIAISEATVKIYRGQVMRKMQARTFADLVVMAQTLGLTQIAQSG